MPVRAVPEVLAGYHRVYPDGYRQASGAGGQHRGRRSGPLALVSTRTVTYAGSSGSRSPGRIPSRISGRLQASFRRWWTAPGSAIRTVGIGLDKNGDVCRFERFQKSWQDTIAYIRTVTGKLPALVDSTGVGDPDRWHWSRQER